MSSVTIPQARIPIGWAMVGGQRIPVEIDMEWMRAFAALIGNGGNGGASLELLLSNVMALEAHRASPNGRIGELERQITELRDKMELLQAPKNVDFSHIEAQVFAQR